MSKSEDIRFLEGVYAEWARGEFRRSDMFSEDVEFVTDFPEKATHRGRAGVAEGWQYFLSSWSGFTTTAEEIVDAGNGNYLIMVRLGGSGKESGVPIEAHAANVATVRDGSITRFQLFFHRDEARAAVGLA
jgi:ketosteroid isomerase-like protein